jgi:hypothetical protein
MRSWRSVLPAVQPREELHSPIYAVWVSLCPCAPHQGVYYKCKGAGVLASLVTGTWHAWPDTRNACRSESVVFTDESLLLTEVRSPVQLCIAYGGAVVSPKLSPSSTEIVTGLLVCLESWLCDQEWGRHQEPRCSLPEGTAITHSWFLSLDCCTGAGLPSEAEGHSSLELFPVGLVSSLVLC